MFLISEWSTSITLLGFRTHEWDGRRQVANKMGQLIVSHNLKLF